MSTGQRFLEGAANAQLTAALLTHILPVIAFNPAIEKSLGPFRSLFCPGRVEVEYPRLAPAADENRQPATSYNPGTDDCHRPDRLVALPCTSLPSCLTPGCGCVPARRLASCFPDRSRH